MLKLSVSLHIHWLHHENSKSFLQEFITKIFWISLCVALQMTQQCELLIFGNHGYVSPRNTVVDDNNQKESKRIQTQNLNQSDEIYPSNG